MITALIIGGAFLAATAAGLAGFAFALIASAIWLHILPPEEAVPLIVSAGLAIHVVGMLQLRSIVRFRSLAPFLLGGIGGVPVGTWLLTRMDADALRVTVGVVMISYAGYMLLRPSPPSIQGGGRLADAAVGWLGGVLGGVAGLSGVLPTIWCDLRGWPKDEQRGVYQPFILAMHMLSVVALGAGGLVTEQTAYLFLIMLPALLLGSWLGVRLYRAASAQQFRRVLLVLLLISGLSLAA